MSFAVASSTAFDLSQALREVLTETDRQQNHQSIDLAIVYYSSAHISQAETIARAIHGHLQPRVLLGCSAESLVANRLEIENQAAIVLWTAHWDRQVQLEAFRLQAETTPDGLTILGWPDSILEANPNRTAVILFGDPFSLPVSESLLPAFNEDFPGIPLFGGIASGMNNPGELSLIYQDEAFRTGAVGVMISGPLRFHSIVSQGAKPIGEPKVITKGKDFFIMELSGQLPVNYIREVLLNLSEHDQQLCQRGGLMIGLAMSEFRDKFERGDFLIRPLQGFDPQTGTVVITDRIRVGQTVQFQLRDAESSDQDLLSMLHRSLTFGIKPQSALVFTCNGRGTRMFSEPHHDAKAIQDVFGPLPTAGFFAAGEFGPVGGNNFIHGFTASIVFFEDAPERY